MLHFNHYYSRQFKLHYNWLKHCRPWIHWSLDWEHHSLPSPCLIPPHDALGLRVLKLHVTYGNCHHLVVEWIIHMASECRLILQVFDMIQAVWRLSFSCIHFIKSHPLPSPCTHILNKNTLSLMLLRKIIILNVIITIACLIKG